MKAIEHVDRCRAVRSETERSWVPRIASFVLLSGHLGYVLVREYIQKAPVAQSALSPTGLLSLAAGYPLLKDARRDAFEDKRFTVNQFLSVTLLTLLATRSPARGFTVMLVMSCPCATVLAASTAVSAAIHNAARRQILVKGGVYLEQIGEADTYCFDKTGTITTAEPEIVGIVGEDEVELLRWAACAELHNPHTLASAVLARAATLGIEPEPPEMSEHILGQGVKARIDEHDILLGNRRMMLDARIDVSRYIGDTQRMIAQGQTAVYVAGDGRLMGVMGVSHRLRPGAQSVLDQLRASGVRRMVLISGDERPIAEALSSQLGLDACHAGLLPEEKARLVNELRRQGGMLARISHRGGRRRPIFSIHSDCSTCFSAIPCGTCCYCRRPIVALADSRSLSLAVRSTRRGGYEFRSRRRESGCEFPQDNNPR